MADDLSGVLTLPTRDAVRDQFLQRFSIRVPDADTGSNTLPYALASVHADMSGPQYNNASVLFDSTNLLDVNGNVTARGDRLKAIGLAEIGAMLPAVGASGFVTVSTATGGSTIFVGDELRYLATGMRYRCTLTGLYADAGEVPVIGIDVGPVSNLDAAKQLVWSNPRPGCNPTCTVTEQSDGSGLTGGRDVESEEEYALRIVDRRQHPKASGNEAEIIAAIEATPGLSVQKAFVIPAIFGAGTKAFLFTLRPSRAGASRAPNATQITLAEANLRALFPGDDGIFGCSLSESDVTIALEVTWTRRAAGWVDATPWPAYASTIVKVNAGATPTASSFRLTTSVDTTTPQVGQTIGFWDSTTGTFKRKRILTVTVLVANRSWTIACDMTNGASDATYVPVVGQAASPWSDSLDLLAPPILAYFDGIGPGEQVASFADPGVRQRRIPENPTEWPSEIRNRILDPLFNVNGLSDVALLAPSVPYVTPTGTPGVLSYLLTLGDLAVFAQ